MALDPPPIFNAIVTHAAGLGLFESVNGHPAKVSPGYGLVYTLEWVRMGPARRSSGLAAAGVRIEFAATVVTSLEQEPADAIDPHLMAATGKLFEAYLGDFTLGGLVRMVDVFGAEGEPLQARPTYATVGGVKARGVVITLPVVVDGVFPEAP